MQTTHTPGPWHIAAAQDRTYPHAIESRDSSFDGFQLARCVNPADARLIAAAPAMLEALRDLVEVTPETYDTRHEIAAARDAIAAAQGDA